MPVEKTVEELRKNIALHFYNVNYPQAYTQEEIYKYEKEVDYFMALIQEVKSQVRREVVEELLEELLKQARITDYADRTEYDVAYDFINQLKQK